MIQRTTSLSAFAMAFAAMLIMSGTQELYSENLQGCSTLTLNGSYGFYRTGEQQGVTTAAVGKVTYDGNGNWTVRQIVSSNGEFANSKFSGRIEIAADCTVKILNENGDLLLASGIVVDDGNGFFLLNRGPGNTFFTVGRKIHSN